MSPWSNRFVSLVVAAALAGCSVFHGGSAPVREATAADASTSASGTGTAVSAADGAAGGLGIADTVPIPERAARQYADALRLMKAGRTADAETQFKQLTVAYPELSGPQVNLGLLYLQDGHLPEAEAAFTAALARNPANAVAGNELGIVERKLGKFAAAETAYQRTIAAEPNYAPAYLNLGVLYDLYLAEPKKALEQFEHYVQLAGENKQVAGWMAELRKRVGASAPAVKKEPA